MTTQQILLLVVAVAAILAIGLWFLRKEPKEPEWWGAEQELDPEERTASLMTPSELAAARESLDALPFPDTWPAEHAMAEPFPTVDLRVPIEVAAYITANPEKSQGALEAAVAAPFPETQPAEHAMAEPFPEVSMSPAQALQAMTDDAQAWAAEPFSETAEPYIELHSVTDIIKDVAGQKAETAAIVQPTPFSYEQLQETIETHRKIIDGLNADLAGVVDERNELRQALTNATVGPVSHLKGQVTKAKAAIEKLRTANKVLALKHAKASKTVLDLRAKLKSKGKK